MSKVRVLLRELGVAPLDVGHLLRVRSADLGELLDRRGRAVVFDPQAVETTRANALVNGVELNSTAPDALPAADYDIVVSNILAQPLIVLAPLLARRGARIALSGILEAQADEVAHAYEPWFETGIADRDGGWILLAGKRR